MIHIGEGRVLVGGRRLLSLGEERGKKTSTTIIE